MTRKTESKDIQRLEAFSDGVIAIIITVMVLELRPPRGAEPRDLAPLAPVFLSYVMSFAYLGIYWNNHHHLIGAATRLDGRLMWSNLHLLFWLSLIPFATAWMGHQHAASWPTALYGAILLMSALAYTLLQSVVLSGHDKESSVQREVGRDWKGKASLSLYMIGTLAAFQASWFSHVLFAAVALMWIVPDRRVRNA
jgi:uncharacterized membrane protein